ncbi:hypothetical protein HZA57_05605, partial [Candidatus Poribacteria bacterium]|nr:hypothetical protein [Candidatus Poribacteria bacterium]
MSFPDAPPDLSACLADARHAALLAWGRISHFHNGTFRVFQKPDGPATEADHLADQVIVRYLEERYPRDTHGFLSEEFENDPERLERGRVWIIDPIDGTEDFMKGRGDFAIHIALAARGEDGVFHPAVAVVYHPMAGVIYSAIRGCSALAEHEVRAEAGAFWWTGGTSDPKAANFAEPH